MAISKNSKNIKNIVISEKVKNHEKDPFFVKKAKEAEAFLNKHGLPAALTR